MACTHDAYLDSTSSNGGHGYGLGVGTRPQAQLSFRSMCFRVSCFDYLDSDSAGRILDVAVTVGLANRQRMIAGIILSFIS